MKRLHKSLVMPYSTAQIYTLVADIAAYPEFLPWCGGARILTQKDQQVEAEVVIAKGPIRLAFVTTNTLVVNERIDMQLKSGPFRQLTGGWLFESLGEKQCRVTLTLSFDFSNRLLAMSVGAVFEQVVGSLVDAFLLRARELYGS